MDILLLIISISWRHLVILMRIHIITTVMIYSVPTTSGLMIHGLCRVYHICVKVTLVIDTHHHLSWRFYWSLTHVRYGMLPSKHVIYHYRGLAEVWTTGKIWARWPLIIVRATVSSKTRVSQVIIVIIICERETSSANPELPRRISTWRTETLAVLII